MGISLLAYVATFSGQFYFRGRFFFTLLQSSHFGTSYFFEAAISSEHLIFLRSFFFRTVTSSQQLLFFQNSCCFRAKLLSGNYHMRIGSSLGQLLFGTATFFSRGIVQNKYIYRRATFSKQVLLQNISFFRKGKFWKKANFSVKQYSALATFSGELPFYSSYFLKRRYLNILFQKSYQFTAALPFHNYNSYLSVSN